MTLFYPGEFLLVQKQIVSLHLSWRSRVNQEVMCRPISSSNKLTHGPNLLTDICVIPYFASSKLVFSCDLFKFVQLSLYDCIATFSSIFDLRWHSWNWHLNCCYFFRSINGYSAAAKASSFRESPERAGQITRLPNACLSIPQFV